MGPKSLADWLPTVLLPPPSVRNRIGDTMRIGLLEPISGIYGSYGVLAALLERERTGRPRREGSFRRICSTSFRATPGCQPHRVWTT